MRGMEVCYRHGGGALALARAREDLSNPRIGPQRKEKALRMLGRAARNRDRTYRDEDRQETIAARTECAEVMPRVRRLIEQGAMTAEFVCRARRVALGLRPYREAHAELAAALYAEGVGTGDRMGALIEFCRALGLDAVGRDQARLALGAPGL
jgi:hypothetical protein